MLEAQERWPHLWQFLGSYLHQDWPEIHGTPQAAIELAIRDYPLEARQQVATEWWDWNVREGSSFDPRPAIREGLGVNIEFETSMEARQFMNRVYDWVIVSIRREAGRDWKP